MRVQSLSRAVQILTCLADEPAAISDVARQVGLAHSTTSRLLKAMDALELVERREDSTYALGPAIARLAAGIEPATKLQTVAGDELDRLAHDSGEAAGLSVRDGDDVLYLAQSNGPNEVQIRDWTGERVPLHAVSSGLVFLASADRSDVEDYLTGGLERFTDQTICEPETLRSRITQVREVGHAWTIQEFNEGVNSLAAPVVDSTGVLVGAVHCHGPAYRFPAAEPEVHAERLLASAARISKRLGPAIRNP